MQVAVVLTRLKVQDRKVRQFEETSKKKLNLRKSKNATKTKAAPKTRAAPKSSRQLQLSS